MERVNFVYLIALLCCNDNFEEKGKMCDPFLCNKKHSITTNHPEDIGLNRK